jgi:hypothetical protein
VNPKSTGISSGTTSPNSETHASNCKFGKMNLQYKSKFEKSKYILTWTLWKVNTNPQYMAAEHKTTEPGGAEKGNWFELTFALTYIEQSFQHHNTRMDPNNISIYPPTKRAKNS